MLHSTFLHTALVRSVFSCNGNRQYIYFQEESKHFVTKENLEEKIEYALENESNYNFAITPDGDKLYSTKPPGNFTDIGWRGTSPAAFLMGGISLGENDFLFEKRYASTVENQNDEEQVDSENIETSKSRPLE